MNKSPFTVYSTPWCGYCIRLKYQLKREGIAFETVNITKDRAAASLVERVNRGNQTVPTVVFADGSALTNPSLLDIRQHLSAA